MRNPETISLFVGLESKENTVSDIQASIADECEVCDIECDHECVVCEADG